jgi:16S rRNA processing protein RimM
VPPRLVALAEVARPHGIAGELRLKVYNLDSDILLRRPPVLLRMPDESGRVTKQARESAPVREARITAARAVDKAVLIKLAGVDDRNAAEAQRGAEICVPRASLAPPEEGEFYACDVEGAEARLGGEPIGRVLELRSYPTCEVLVVERPGGSTLEVPLLEAYVGRIDADGGVVELVSIEGLE